MLPRAPARGGAPSAAPQLASRRALAGAALPPPPSAPPAARLPRGRLLLESRMHGLQKFVDKVEQEQLKTDLPPMRVGMTVKVGVTVVEGTKTRVQPYQGLVIAMHKHALASTITVRKTFQGVGVERVFPIHSPLVSIEPVPTAGVPRVRRAKLYFLRDRVGKAAKLKQYFVSKDKGTPSSGGGASAGAAGGSQPAAGAAAAGGAAAARPAKAAAAAAAAAAAPEPALV